MKKEKLFFIPFLSLSLIFCGCSQTQNENSAESGILSEKNVVSNITSNSNEKNQKNGIKINSSSFDNPLSLEEWGECAKYSTKERKYEDIPVRITSYEHGQNAKKTVKELFNSSDIYTYKEPQKGYEWIVAHYEISLDGFSVDEGGADGSIAAFITGKDGNSLKKNEKSISSEIFVLTDNKYYFEGISSGDIVYILPENFKEYCLVIGEYGEIQAVFSE